MEGMLENDGSALQDPISIKRRLESLPLETPRPLHRLEGGLCSFVLSMACGLRHEHILQYAAIKKSRLIHRPHARIE